MAQTMPAVAPKRIKVSQEEAAKKLIQYQNPKIPVQEFKGTEDRTVVLRAVIGIDGMVKEIVPVSGEQALMGPSQEALRKWRYTPFRRKGEAVEAEVMIYFRFHLRRR